MVHFMTSFGMPTQKILSALIGPLLIGATLAGCSDDPAAAPASDRSSNTDDQPPSDSNAAEPTIAFDGNFEFTPTELEAVLQPLEDAIDDSGAATESNVFVREAGASYGIYSNCPQVFHEPTFSLRQVTTGGTLILRDVYLYPSEAAPRDAFTALAATPEGCNTSPLTSVDEPVTSVDVSQFQGLDAITMRLDVMAPGDTGADSVQSQHWVRRGNVVVHVRIQNSATSADALLSDALASIDRLAG